MYKYFKKKNYFIIIFFLFSISNFSFANENVTKNWCNSTIGSGWGNHPIPGKNNFFDPCPGRTLKKIPFEKVINHFSSGEGKQHICNLIDGSSRSNKRLTVYFDLVAYLKLDCVDLVKEKERKRKLLEKKIADEKARKKKERLAKIEKARKIREEQDKIRKKEEELALKKKQEEIDRKNKLAAEKAKKNKLLEDKKRKATAAKLKDKITKYKLNAADFYNDIQDFVKEGGDVDLIKLSDYFEVRPDKNKKWDNNDLSRYIQLRKFMDGVNGFIKFETDKKNKRFQIAQALKDKSIIQLNRNLKKLNVLMRQNFGTKESKNTKIIIKEIQRILSKYDQFEAANIINKSNKYISAQNLKKKQVTEQNTIAKNKKLKKSKTFFEKDNSKLYGQSVKNLSKKSANKSTEITNEKIETKSSSDKNKNKTTNNKNTLNYISSLSSKDIMSNRLNDICHKFYSVSEQILTKLESESETNLISFQSLIKNKFLFNTIFNTSTFSLTTKEITNLNLDPLQNCGIVLGKKYNFLKNSQVVEKNKIIKNNITIHFNE